MLARIHGELPGQEPELSVTCSGEALLAQGTKGLLVESRVSNLVLVFKSSEQASHLLAVDGFSRGRSSFRVLLAAGTQQQQQRCECPHGVLVPLVNTSSTSYGGAEENVTPTLR